MANLGYFQLKGNPGPWRLGIRAGKSTDMYSFESIGAQGWRSGDVKETGDSLFVSTLEGITLYPRLRGNPGYEASDLLDDSLDVRSAGSVLDRVKAMYVSPLAAGRHPC